MKSIEVGHYPFEIGAEEENVNAIMLDQIKKLTDHPLFPSNQREAISRYLSLHFLRAAFMFWDEEQLREQGLENANLFYHNKDHAVFQTTYDALCVDRAILSRQDKFSSHLTLEGAIAIPIAGSYHDSGFVYQKHPLVNFAQMSPIHVEESKRAAVESIDRMHPPENLDTEKIKKLVIIGIHGTHFPYDETRKAEGKRLIDELSQGDRQEGQIVRLAVQFADLGGQTARVDQNPEGLRRLREEMNACTPDMGTKIIGKDEYEMEEKRKQFLNFVIERTVGRTGNAFFGTREHSYAREWHKTPVASR